MGWQTHPLNKFADGLAHTHFNDNVNGLTGGTMERHATNRIAYVFCSLILGISVFIIGMASDANAQYYTSRSNQLYNNSLYSVKAYSASISELNQIISVKRQKTTVKQVLEEIARKADLGIAYNAELEVLEKKISVDFQMVTVGAALQKVLAKTGYEAALSKTREIVLLKKPTLRKAEREEVFDKELTGQVVNGENGNTLPAVNVFVEGTNIGTSTDEEGRFTLTVPDDAETLVFSFIGFERLEIQIGDQTEFRVELVPEVSTFEDIVVVGYGTQQRAEVTGSVATVRPEVLENVPVSSFENALQGQMAGVNVAESTGEPGATPQILIRGMGSISAGNSPLYVIDGLPISKNTDLQGELERRRDAFAPPKANPLATINPNDIASIEVLKDASAAAIYGSRGSNGVVLITTKSGQIGAPQINFGVYGGVQSVLNKPDMMNAAEVIVYTQDSRNNAYMQEYDPTNPSSPTYNPNYDPTTNAGRVDENGDVLGENYILPEKYINWDGTDTDWLDLVVGDAILQNYDLSVSGGSQNLRYYISGGYLNQTGIIDGSGFKRYTLKANVTGDISDRFQVGMILNSAFTDHDRLPASAPYFARPPGIIYSAMVHSPVIKPYNDDGSYNQLDGQSQLGGGTTTASHPLAIRDNIEETIKNNRVFGNFYGQYSILENLQFKSMLGFDLDNYQRHFYRGINLFYRGSTDPDPYAQSSASQGLNWLWENTLNYNTTLAEDHRLNVLAGYTAQKQTDDRNSIFAENFPDDQVKTLNGGVITGGSQSQEEWSLVSALARVNYVFKDKYLLTATIRADRSSRFGSDNQTGIFPSVSVGWRATEEPFMENIDLFNELKLRVSYGVTGNFEIPNYGSIGLLDEANYVFNDEETSGLGPETIGNDELSWETTYQFNAGLDFAMLQDRIYGSFDYYISNTKDLLLNVTVPSASGFDEALTNIGEVENKGFEMQVTSRNIVGGFNWATDFNFGSNKNEVLKLGPEGDPILSTGGAGLRHITRIGDAIGSYFGYVVDGIYQSQAEIDSAPEDLEAPDPRPGDFRFKDINGDGVINPDDRTVTGSYHPDFTYGITNRFSYKNFDLSVFVQGVEGREILNLTARHMKNGEANFNSYAVLNDRWISPEDPGNGKHPRADRVSALHGNNNRPSSYQVEDGSYIRIKNITLGYNVPPQLLGQLGNFSRRMRIYGSITNVAIWTDYIGWNPEVSLQASNSLTPGEDYGAYPLARAVQLGIELSF